jgi:hypothetical protein
MTEEIRQKLNLFVSNAQTVKRGFAWHDVLVKKMAALLYALEDKAIDYGAIKDAHTMLKHNTGVFSAFRGNMALCLAAMLSLRDDRQALFDRTVDVYEMLKAVKFRASDYLTVAALEIASQAKHEDYRGVVNRTREFYDGMKVNGFFRTGQDDYVFSAMLGLTDIDVKDGVRRIDELFRRFKPKFWSKNSVQTLAQVIVLSGDCETAVSRILTLRDAMRKRGIRLDRAYTLPSLGVLALLPVEVETVVQDVEAAQDFLRTQRGFGAFTIDRQSLLLFAAAVVSSVYAKDIEKGAIKASVSTSITSIIIAQQAAMMAAIVSASAASSAAAAGR